jgi:hypothetical protein
MASQVAPTTEFVDVPGPGSDAATATQTRHEDRQPAADNPLGPQRVPGRAHRAPRHDLGPDKPGTTHASVSMTMAFAVSR